MVRDVCRNDWNKDPQYVTEEFSWKLQCPFYKNNAVVVTVTWSMIGQKGLALMSFFDGKDHPVVLVYLIKNSGP